MKIAFVSITKHGIILASKVINSLANEDQVHLFCPTKFSEIAQVSGVQNFSTYEGKVGDQVQYLFMNFDAIVAVVSLGAVVRLIAPHIKKKETDPAVLVIDEAGKFVISVLSGHLGGANFLTQKIAQIINAQAVITTASDSRQTLAVDLLGKELGWTYIATHDEIVRCSAAVVNDEPVALIQECGDNNWWTNHANGRSGKLPINISLFTSLEEVSVDKFSAILWISNRPLPEKYQQQLAGRMVKYQPI